MRQFLVLFITLVLFSISSFAQSDSTAIAKPAQRVYTHYDSVRLARLNSSGNLMIAGGIGLCGAGGYLLYQGNKVYTTSPTITDPAIRQNEINRNRRQGTIYYAAGGIAIAGGIILTALGARNKVEFKTRKRMMEFESGILHNGNLGLALNF